MRIDLRLVTAVISASMKLNMHRRSGVGNILFADGQMA
ncbi:hypothetical protein BH10PLA1_BH10PLA1_06280 [soil metagenome]